jgi:uncharacterized damage-inducible protein DinB
MNSQSLIDAYSNGADDLSQAIRGLTPEDMLARPAPDAKVGLWSIQEVTLHVADCDAVFTDRMKRLIAEDNPTLMAFDENKWAAALQYNQQSAQDAATLFELTRKQMVKVLHSLPQAAFQRAGTHSEAGRLTLADVVKKSVDHLAHHVKFIHAKRAHMGKEMW